MVYLPPFVDKEDLIEYGILGLIEASEKYDSKKDTKFGTYAISRIRGAILDYLRSLRTGCLVLCGIRQQWLEIHTFHWNKS